MTFLEWLIGQKGEAIMAGAAGGTVRWLTLREDWRSGLISIAVGAICSYYLTPLTLPLLEPVLGRFAVQTDQLGGLCGFLVGIGGITVSGFILDLWKARRARISAQASSHE